MGIIGQIITKSWVQEIVRGGQMYIVFVVNFIIIIECI